jgi:hypothetical protein
LTLTSIKPGGVWFFRIGLWHWPHSLSAAFGRLFPFDADCDKGEDHDSAYA